MAATKIILVDDKPVYRNALKTFLNKLGEVEIIAEAANGIEFLNLLKTNKPDVVFMDIEMPDMNGVDATRQAIQLYPDMIIIGLSMYDDQKYVDQLLEVGARGYLLKLSDNSKIFKTILEHPTNEIFFSKEIEPKTKVETTSKGKPTVLIVDDFENTRYVIEFTLKQAGFEVMKAVDGLDALRYFDGKHIDLLITDFNMPRMDGLELVKEVRQIEAYKQLPILLLTTEVDPEKKRKAKEAGITGWIQKPFVIDKFLAMVRKALR